MVSILLLYGNRFPSLLTSKVAVLTCCLLYKELIGDELLWFYDIHVTHTKFLDKIRNLLVLLNIPQTEYGVRIILKDASNLL